VSANQHNWLMPLPEGEASTGSTPLDTLWCNSGVRRKTGTFQEGAIVPYFTITCLPR